MDTASDPIFFNPLAEGYLENPWPHLAELRAADPVHHLITGQWGLFRYDDVFALLRNPELSVEIGNADQSVLARAEMLNAIDPEDQNTSILNLDPPDHTRLRRLVSKAFTPRTVQALRPGIQRMVDAMLDQMADEGISDVVDRLAFPLPFDVISEMLGMPASDKEQIKEWSGAIVKTIDPIVTEEDLQAAAEADVLMSGLIAEIIEWKADNPGDDLLTAMIEAEDGGDRMTAKELRDQVGLLFIAGHETTVNLIGTGIYELLRHPDQLALVRDADAMPPTAIDELLRWVSPVQNSRRIATSDFVLRDKHIPKGAFVLASLASANHDPEFWGPDAETLNLHRDIAGQHVAFGSGIHYCLGSSLAKLEAEVAIGSFVRRFGQVALAEEPVWNGRINLRGLATLRVDLR
jgi:cytochrome P450